MGPAELQTAQNQRNPLRRLNPDQQVSELIGFAKRQLPEMRLADGMYCLEVKARDMRPRGRSVRYSAMVALGMLRARAAGHAVEEDLDQLVDLLLAESGSPRLAPGDLGLLLWLNCRAGSDRASELVQKLLDRIDHSVGMSGWEGMEVAWTAIGASECAASDEVGGADRLLRASRAELRARSQSPSELFFHRGPGPRRRFPNFATQIYGTLALASLGRRGDEESLAAAQGVADEVLRLQQSDGGWPWLFDAIRGKVVEPYHVYSVHQVGMAPMALLELYEATGEDRYRAASVRGLGWMNGDNAIDAQMLDRDRHIMYRSIRRRLPWNRIVLYLNTVAACANREPFSPAHIPLDINATGRPYELGWILEAWCGREQLATSP